MNTNKEISSLSHGLLKHRLAGFTPSQAELSQFLPEFEEELSQFLGKKMRPSPARALGDFGLLPQTQQENTVAGLKAQLAFMREAVKAGITVYEEANLVRMAMSKLCLSTQDDVMENLETSDVVEILSPDHTQFYRSYSCFALCHYSVAELVTYPWYELYDRPSWVQDKLFELSQTVINGERSHLDLEDRVPPYLLQETLTPEKASFMVQEKFYSRMVSALDSNPYLFSVKRIKQIEAGAGLKFI